MEYKANNNRILTFLTPALVSVGSGVLLLILQIIASIPLIGIFWNLPEFGNPLYNPIWNLIILFTGQILGTLIVLVFLIPWLRIKDVEHQPLNKYAFGSTLLIICLTWALILVKAVILVFGIEYFQLEPPKTGLDSLFMIDEIINPITFLILVAPIAIGAPIFEELVYRRLLIPLLEKRGLSPFGAVLASSLFFTLLHAPADIINGNMTGTILHLTSVLILAFALGFTYIVTRNIIFPIMIHGFVNGIPLPQIILEEGSDISMAYSIFYLIILVAIGLIYLIFLLLTVPKEKNPIIKQIIHGKIPINSIEFYGYFIISLGLLTLHTISSVYLLDLSSLVISPILLIVIWLIIRSDLSSFYPSFDKTTENI
jgi:membrane protease YdiL (CAAX protease family)